MEYISCNVSFFEYSHSCNNTVGKIINSSRKDAHTHSLLFYLTKKNIGSGYYAFVTAQYAAWTVLCSVQ
jgi:hypothetical protein